ncbi:putative protein-export membrane protein SecG [bioreactor metagenome]|uniref:Protein-export membrane protein SecG n=1 Tax=bioreactor metagenome TaxID=1076179 RepID=A0A645IRY6_9ZZZZ
MSTLTIVLSVIQMICCLILIAVIILQQGKSAGLSGAISGASETFFGKNKGRSIEGKLERYTTWVAALFMVLTLVIYLL